MKATARRTSHFQYDVTMRDHRVGADEAEDIGGDDAAPSPQELLAASLASCTAITMEMYAQRKGWDIGTIEVEAEFTPPDRGCPTKFRLIMRLPSDLSEEQVERLKVIAAKCPIHRTLDSDVMFDEQIELVEVAR
jgi:putative redox protein